MKTKFQKETVFLKEMRKETILENGYIGHFISRTILVALE